MKLMNRYMYENILLELINKIKHKQILSMYAQKPLHFQEVKPFQDIQIFLTVVCSNFGTNIGQNEAIWAAFWAKRADIRTIVGATGELSPFKLSRDRPLIVHRPYWPFAGPKMASVQFNIDGTGPSSALPADHIGISKAVMVTVYSKQKSSK